MRSIWLMVIANIRKRITQSILVGLTLLVSSLLFATAIGVLGSIKDPFNRMFEAQKGSHVTMLLEDLKVDPNVYVAWWQAKEAVESVHSLPYYDVSDKMMHNGELQIYGHVMVTEHPGLPLNQDKLVIVEGNEQSSPAENEIWIPTGYAYSWGIEVGDILGLLIGGEMREMKVSAIVVDPQFSAGLINPVRVWVAQGMHKKLFTDEESATMIGVRFFDYNQYDKLWQEFEAFLGDPFIGFNLEYEFLEFAYGLIQNILGVILLLFSVVIIVIILFVIAFTISNSILSDYHIIGILKAQGFSSKDIKRVYIWQYLLLACVFIPTGIFLSQFVVKMIMIQMVKGLGVAKFSYSIWFPALITLITMWLVIYLIALKSSSKTAKIQPADAIRNSIPRIKSRKRRMDLTKIKGLPISIIISIKSIISNKRQSLFIIVSSAMLAFVLVFSVNMYNSVKRIGENASYWGFDSADVHINRDDRRSNLSNEEIQKMIYEDKRVRESVPFNVITNCAIPAQEGKTSRNVVAFTFDGDMDAIGMLNIKGKNPVRDNEVAISILVAEKYNKDIGDVIDVFINGQTGSFLITGIYQSLNGMGWGFRIQEAGAKTLNPTYQSSRFAIRLKQEIDSDEFIKHMSEILPEGFEINPSFDIGEINSNDIASNMAIVTLIISMVFVIVSFIIIFNTTLMAIYKEKKSFGIYKSIGMTPVQIRLSLIWKSLGLTIIGVSMGIPLSLLISPKLPNLVLVSMGMVKFPFDVTILGTLAAIPICLIVTFLSTWLPSGRILGISPRNLIVE